MRLVGLLCYASFLFLSGNAYGEGNCPSGQYPVGGQGAVGCAPIPQNQPVQQAPRPTGRWIETWGAIAMGSIDSINSYGVTTGRLSRSEAESDALRRCASHGETNCQIGVVYKNQCAAAAEPQINGKTFDGGGSTFAGEVSIKKASAVALKRCKEANKDTPYAACKIIYSACTEQIFEKY